jgi:hypothetical protein
MAFTDQVRDALARVHVATRALKISRDIEQTHHRLAADFPCAGFLIDDVTQALVQRLHEAEAALAALLSAEGGSITDPVHGHVLASRLNDRRHRPRRQFVLTRLAASPYQRRAQA